MSRRFPIVLAVFFCLHACGSDSPTSSEPQGDSGGFEVVGRMTISRFWHVAVQLKSGRVLIAGGTETDRSAHSQADMYHDSAELFDLERGASSTTGKMSQARTQDTAILLNDGRVAMMRSGNYPVEIFDPGTGRFTAASSIPTFGPGNNLTLLFNGDVFVSDGRGNAAIFNADTGAFSSIKRMIASRSAYTATRLSDGRVLIAGGTNGGDMVRSCEIFDPSTGDFTRAADLNDARWRHKAMLLQDGRVLIIGGRRDDVASEDVQFVPSAEFFDPETGTFAPAGDTGLPSIDAAFLLPTGKVFVLSGTDVAIYDPATGNASRTGHSIGQNRILYTVTPLSDGRVMVSGGLKDMVSTDEVLVYKP